MSTQDFQTIMTAALTADQKIAATNAMASGNLTPQQAIALVSGAAPQATPKSKGKAAPKAEAAATALTSSDLKLLEIIKAQTSEGREMALAAKVHAFLHACGVPKEKAIALCDDAYTRRVIAKRFAPGKAGKGGTMLYGDARVIEWKPAREKMEVAPTVAASVRSAFGL